MSEVHRCHLHQSGVSALEKLPPNASCFRKLMRRIRILSLVNPNNSRCISFFHSKSAVMSEQKRHIKSRYTYIIHPFSDLKAFLEVSFFILWLSKMIYAPVLDNLIPTPEIGQAIDMNFVALAQDVLVVSFFFVGYIDTKSREVEIRPRKVARRYLLTFFLFDVATGSTFKRTTFWIIHKSITEHNTKTILYDCIRCLQVFCLYVRLYTVLEYLEHICELLKMNPKLRKCISYAIKTLLILHAFSCLLYYVPRSAYHDKWPEDSWLSLAKIAPVNKPSFYRIYEECLLMTVCFFFGASAGKYNVYRTNEQISLCCVTLFGRLYTLFLLADTLRLLGIVGISESSYEKQVVRLKEYMVSNNLPPTLRGRMIRYFETKLQKRYFNEHEILNSLSDTLRAEIFLFSATKLMNKANMFKYLSQNEVNDLVSMMRLKSFAPGDVIFRPDHLGSDIYFINSGSVAIFCKAGNELCHLEDGEMFGLCGALLGKKILSAVVVETSDVFVMNSVELTNFLDAHPVAALYMYDLAKERLNKYQKMEENFKSKVDSCLVELKKGALLEKRRKKKIAE